MTEPLFIAKSEHKVFLYPRMANRHGLVAGATGTGKTVTLQTMAERAAKNNPFNQILGSVGNQMGKEITRGLMGTLFGTSTRRRR